MRFVPCWKQIFLRKTIGNEELQSKIISYYRLVDHTNVFHNRNNIGHFRKMCYWKIGVNHGHKNMIGYANEVCDAYTRR